MRISDWSSDVCSSDLFRHSGAASRDQPDRRRRYGPRRNPSPYRPPPRPDRPAAADRLRRGGRRSSFQIGDERAHGGADIVALQGKRDIGGDEARLVAAIVADGIDGKTVEGLLTDPSGHGAGQLDL